MKHKLKIITLFCTILVTQAGQAIGLSDAQRQILDSGIYYFDQDVGSVNCSVDLPINLSGNNNAEVAFNFFVSQGFSAEQSAGIVGNLIFESQVNPEALNGGGRSSLPPSDTGKAWGIAQWLGGRPANLVAYAATQNLQPNDLALQLKFIVYELKGDNGNNGKEAVAYKALLDSTNVSSNPTEQVVAATTAFFQKYERAGDSTAQKRITRALGAYSQYSGNLVTNVYTTSSSSDCTSIVGTGKNTVYKDNFTFYDQCDPVWRDLPFGSGGKKSGWCAGIDTIGTNGCGPSAMAMIISTLTGSSVTPAQTASYADTKNQYEPGVGSRFTIAPVLAQNWGLKAEKINMNVKDISANLMAGKLVIISGQADEAFTPGGHYIVIRAATDSQKWLIGDSNKGTQNNFAEWDPQYIVAHGNEGSVYAISR